CVHSFEGKTDTMKVEVMLDEEARVRIQEVLGRDPVGNRIHLTPKIRSMAMDGLIHRVSGTDYLGCFVETVPEKSRPTATKIMEGSDVYLMGLTYLNELFGDVILMFPEKTQLQHQNLLETYLNQASVAVQRQIYQEELRRSREEYRRIVENADEGIWVLDRDYRTTFVNPRLARMLGYVPEELVGVQIERFMLPEDIPAHHRRIAERRTGLSGHFEQRFQRKDGSLIWAAANATPLFESGEFAGAFAMLTDITVEKQAEGALRESEERYRDLTEASFDIIFTIDREDRLAYANRRCLEFLGRRYEEVVGKPRASLFTPEISEKMKENLVKIFSTGEPLLDSANPVVLGDREFWLDTNLIPLKNADGSVNLVMGISRDITLRKKTEDALRESEEKYRALVEQAHDMIVVVQDGIIKFCNQKVAEMWGGDIREIIGQPYERFIDPEELPRVRENYLRRMAGEAAPDLYDTLLLRRDGSRVHVDLSAGTIVFDGRPADLIVLRDITEKKETEEQLKCTYELQKAILDASPVGIGYVSNRTLTWANKAMYRIQGVEPLELRGQHERIVFSDEKEYERVCGQVYHEIGETGFSELETALKRKDGSLVPVSLRAAPIRPGSTDLIILVTDITARKKAEEELRKTHALQQAILAASPMGIGVTANRILIWANEAMSRIHGYGPGEREGQSAQLLYEDEREYERVTREISLAMETGEFRVLETVWRRKDGSRANIRLTVGPVRPGSPEVLSVARDITVQKKAEEELGKTRALKDAILSSSPVGIGVSRNRFLIWENDAMASICGIEKDELEGMPVRAVYESDEEYERITRVGSEAIGSGHFRETETVWVRKDGSSVDVQLSLGPVAPGSSEILAIAQDITARKKAAEQLRQTQALQEAILRASPVGIGLISERTLQWENDAMCEILGIREGELKGQPLDTVFIDEQEYGRTSRVLDQAIRQNGSGEVETVWKRKDGSRVEVSLRVAPVRPGSPEVIGVATDITDRNRAGRALRESEETFRTMVTINPLPLSLIDAKGKYLHVNPSFTRLFGYTLEDIPDGKAWFALAYPDEETREVAIRYWKADAAEHPVGEVRPRTFKVRCKDGSFKDILFLPASTPAGLQVVVYQDLTRETMTERLSDSEDRYRHLVDDLNVGIYRSSGDTEGRFIWGNTGLLSILGYEDLADLRGVPVRDIFQKPGGRKALLRELQEKKFVKNRLLSLKKKDGTPVKVSVTALAEFDEKGKLQFITGLVQEVPRD
ncbi:MAG: PAS domain S-box protein, partial [Methanomicrobiales archaeon]